TSNDAARIAQHVAGISVFTNNNQKVSADVSGNNAISSNDAALIARFVAGLGAPFGNTGQWRFFVPPGPTFPVGSSPTSRIYAAVNTSLAGEDYVGLLIGEVTGNWVPTSARASSPSVSSPHVSKGAASDDHAVLNVDLPTIMAQPENEIVIPIQVAGATGKE